MTTIREAVRRAIADLHQGQILHVERYAARHAPAVDVAVVAAIVCALGRSDISHAEAIDILDRLQAEHT